MGVNPKNKMLWTVIVLFIYLVCSQIPLYGANQQTGKDPFQFVRAILASNRGTLVELGISPIITASMLLQVCTAAKLIEHDQQNVEDSNRYQRASKLLTIIIGLIEAVMYVMSGQQGDVAVLGLSMCIAIICQLFFATILLMLLDEMLTKEYGYSSGISLFIATNVAETIIWKLLSPITLKIENKAQYEGAIIEMIYVLITYENKTTAINHAFFREAPGEGLPNIMQLISTIGVFLLVVFLQGFKIKMNFQNNKVRHGTTGREFKLFYNSNMPIILQTALISNMFMLSQFLYENFPDNMFVRFLGVWDSTNHYSATNGVIYQITPPSGLSEIIKDPVKTVVQVLFITITCSILSYLWIELSGTSPKDIDKEMKKSGESLKGCRSSYNKPILYKYIPRLAVMGGFLIAILSIISDFVGSLNSGTGILLAVGIVYEIQEKIQQENSKLG